MTEESLTDVSQVLNQWVTSPALGSIFKMWLCPSVINIQKNNLHATQNLHLFMYSFIHEKYSMNTET
jgi:hypothetical protein